MARIAARRRLLALLVALLTAGTMSAQQAANAQQSSFEDVPADAYYSTPVSSLADQGVLDGTGCGDHLFCPTEPVLRWQMAVWIVRVLDGQEPPPVPASRFTDIDARSWYAAHIERMHELKVTSGCGDGTRFCPDRPVTRAQMAVFLTRAFDLPEAPDPGFTDVAVGAWYAKQVASLYASGITSGCGDGTRFCPERQTTRGQMATFLHHALAARPTLTPSLAPAEAAVVELSQMLPWSDDLPYPGALVPFVEVWLRDPDLGRELAQAPWVIDGLAWFEDDAVYGLGRLHDHDPALARRMMAYSTEEPVRVRNILPLWRLGELLAFHRDKFDRLIAQPWFADGLDAGERALVVALRNSVGVDVIHEGLLASRTPLTTTIALPLSGDVTLWVFHNRPLSGDVDILAAVERGVRGAERLMGAPFPLSDVVVSILEVDSCDILCGAVNFGDSLALIGPAVHVEPAGPNERALYHEIAHFYLTAEIGPFWFYEGGADLFAEYLLRQGKHGDRLPLDEQDFEYCRGLELPDLHTWNDPNYPDPAAHQACGYIMGQYFLTSLYNAIGEAPFSSAVRELYELVLEYQHDATDEQVYRVFLKHTPPDREAAFLDVYRRLHGGPFLEGN